VDPRAQTDQLAREGDRQPTVIVRLAGQAKKEVDVRYEARLDAGMRGAPHVFDAVSPVCAAEHSIRSALTADHELAIVDVLRENAQRFPSQVFRAALGRIPSRSDSRAIARSLRASCDRDHAADGAGGLPAHAAPLLPDPQRVT